MFYGSHSDIKGTKSHFHITIPLVDISHNNTCYMFQQGHAIFRHCICQPLTEQCNLTYGKSSKINACKMQPYVT